MYILCIAIECTPLPSIDDGVITYGPDQTANYDHNTIAQYSCNTGHYLQGNVARSCSGDGSSNIGVWTGTNPICIGTYMLYISHIVVSIIYLFKI